MRIPTPERPLSTADFDALITAGVEESVQLDFKSELRIGSESDKKEFLADIVAFANSRGGEIVVGVAEERDEAGRKTGRAGQIVGMPWERGLDDLLLALQSLVDTGIAPRIPGIRMNGCQIREGRFGLALHIPQSYASPHLVKLGGANRFYGRVDRGKVMWDIDQIREGFLRAEALPRRMQAFVDERIGAILEGSGTAAVTGPLAIVHVFPASAFGREPGIDLIAATERRLLFHPIQCGTDRPIFNAEGAFVLETEHEQITGYNQLFRSGIFEGVTNSPFYLVGANNQPHGGLGAISIQYSIEQIVPFVARCLRVLLEVGAAPPVYVYMTIHGVRDHITDQAAEYNRPARKVGRDLLRLPNIELEDLRMDQDQIAGRLRPAFDVLSNAGGFSKCKWFEGDVCSLRFPELPD